MGLYQSFPQVFVTNSPALLAQGKTVDSLAVGQIGFLDAKTYTAVTAPTYAKNKALLAVWGTPNIDNGDFFGAPNENEYSKIIKGKLLKRFRAKAARRGQTPVYSLGWSGDVSDTDTLTAKPGEIKNIWVKLTGGIIDRMHSTQGLTEQFVLTAPCYDNCADDCVNIPCPDMAKQIVDLIEQSRYISKYIRVKSLISCTPAATPPVETDCFKFKITVCDTGDALALGIVQAQYPDEDIVLISRVGALSTYGVVKDANVVPLAYTQQGVFVPECPTCPVGYTLIPQAKVFQVKTSEGVLLAAVQAAFAGESSVTLVNTDPEFNTYMVTFPVTSLSSAVQASALAAGYIATEIGIQSNICQQTTPVSVPWAADGTLKKQDKKYRITLLDSICGTDRLAELQAAYPNSVVTLVNAAGNCVHTYETTVKSNCYAVGCGVDTIKFVAPVAFQGGLWTPVVAPAVVPAPDCKCGVLFETSFFNTNTDECSYSAFPYENDVVHIQISNYNPDYNAEPCENSWAVKQLRSVEYPRGHGAYIRKLEEDSKRYDLRHRSENSVVRGLEGYSLQADPNRYYDEYALEFDTKWFTAGGWSEQYTQSFTLFFYVPEGQGAQLELALNSYITSAGVQEDGAAI